MRRLLRTFGIVAVMALVASGGFDRARGAENNAADDADLNRLAEILGALQYLRPLCGTNEGNRWRDQMTALLDAESAKPASVAAGW